MRGNRTAWLIVVIVVLLIVAGGGLYYASLIAVPTGSSKKLPGAAMIRKEVHAMSDSEWKEMSAKIAGRKPDNWGSVDPMMYGWANPTHSGAGVYDVGRADGFYFKLPKPEFRDIKPTRFVVSQTSNVEGRDIAKCDLYCDWDGKDLAMLCKIELYKYKNAGASVASVLLRSSPPGALLHVDYCSEGIFSKMAGTFNLSLDADRATLEKFAMPATSAPASQRSSTVPAGR